MFTIKNAIKNIYRYKNKYILFGLLYLALILAAFVCMNVFMQMDKVTNNIYKNYANVVRFNKMYRPKAGEIFDFSTTIPRFTKNDFLEFINFEYVNDVKFLSYNFSTYYTEDSYFDPVTGEFNRPSIEFYIDGTVIPSGPLNNLVGIVGYNMSLLHLSMVDFALESGRMFENDDEAVIAKNITSSVMGDWNKLNIGDKIVIKNDDIYKEFTVVGILKPNPTDHSKLAKQVLFTTFASAEYFDIIASEGTGGIGLNDTMISGGNSIEGRDYFRTGYDALIYLNPTEIIADLNRKELMDTDIMAEPVFPEHETITNLIKNMRDNTGIFLIITLLVIVCMTIFSTAILLNSRKYEIAVLRSTGTKKSRLIINYLIENLTFIWGITVVSLVVAQFILPIFTGKMFENMRGLVSVEMIENLTQGTNIDLFQNIGIVFGGTTAVVILSLILAYINIIRFEPLKIFNKQY